MPQRVALAGLTAVFASGAILLGANGALGTLISISADAQGLSSLAIGALGSAFFAGFALGTVFGPRIVRRAGHIRAFAVFAAFMAIASLFFALHVDGYAWAAVRFATGIAFAGLSLVVESWINEKAGTVDRGRVLSVYRVIDLSAVTAGQYLLALFDPSGFEVFSVIAMLFCLALMPVSMTRSPAPKPIQAPKLDLPALYAVSPLAVLSVFGTGVVTSAYRQLGPVYAQAQGLDTTGVATFIAAGVIGGALLQLPLGWASDKVGRRWALLLASIGAIAASSYLAFGPLAGAQALYVASFLFGGFLLPIYSLAIAHANDFAEEGRFVEVAAGLLLTYGLGAIVGPFASAIAFETFGPSGLFAFACAVHAALLAFTAFRSAVGRHSLRRLAFVALIRTSPNLFELDPRARTRETKDH